MQALHFTESHKAKEKHQSLLLYSHPERLLITGPDSRLEQPNLHILILHFSDPTVSRQHYDILFLT